MKTIIIQIGNTDDKLTQMKWARFYADTNHEIQAHASIIHFAAPSPAQAAWQNACWAFVISEEKVEPLKAALKKIRAEFLQDSIAWTEGETQFV